MEVGEHWKDLFLVPAGRVERGDRHSIEIYQSEKAFNWRMKRRPGRISAANPHSEMY